MLVTLLLCNSSVMEVFPKFFIFFGIREEFPYLNIFSSRVEPSTKWSDLSPMPDHNMQLSATERLEEAVSRLTQNQATLT